MSKTARKRAVRLRSSNRFKCLLCYLFCFAMPLLWQLICLRRVYPYTLAGTAPDAAGHLLAAFPTLGGRLTPHPLPQTAGAEALRAALAARENAWLRLVAVSVAAAWAFTLLMQLIWRFTHTRALQTAQATQRAVRHYRLNMLLILLINAAFAALLWLFGGRYIAGFTHWDALVYFGAYGLNVLAALLTSRLAAPPAISGKHGFFKRI